MELFIGPAELAGLARDGIRPEEAREVFSAGRRTMNIIGADGVCVTGGRVGHTTLWVVFREEPSRCVLLRAYFHRIKVEGTAEVRCE